MKKKKALNLKSTKGSVLFSLSVLFIVQCVLNYDFWNWGEQTYYFGFITGEYIWRMVLLLVITPVSYWSIIKFAWPADKTTGGKL